MTYPTGSHMKGPLTVTEGIIVGAGAGNIDQYVDVVISSAQLLALNATPRQLVAAPGAGLALLFTSAIVHKPAGTAYADIAAGEDLAIKYTDASGVQVASIETTGFLDQATAQTRTVQAGSTAITPAANAALVLHLLVGEILTGTSPLNIRVYYRTIPATL